MANPPFLRPLVMLVHCAHGRTYYYGTFSLFSSSIPAPLTIFFALTGAAAYYEYAIIDHVKRAKTMHHMHVSSLSSKYFYCIALYLVLAVPASRKKVLLKDLHLSYYGIGVPPFVGAHDRTVLHQIPVCGSC